MSSGKYFKHIQNESKINQIIKLSMKEKYDNQVKDHRLPLGKYGALRLTFVVMCVEFWKQSSNPYI
jgi:mRNA-degrading endonuclease YafQ of YafQ-DinJ toxin-antitoxin module